MEQEVPVKEAKAVKWPLRNFPVRWELFFHSRVPYFALFRVQAYVNAHFWCSLNSVSKILKIVVPSQNNLFNLFDFRFLSLKNIFVSSTENCIIQFIRFPC